MRETTLLAIAVLAALLGMGLGRLILSKKAAPAALVAAPASVVIDATPTPVTMITPPAASPEPVDPNSTPEAIRAWRRQDKEKIEQRVETLSTAEAEHLCFVLQLIPRDEVFDKINFKGRLKRHIERIRMAAEFSDIETAFHDLERNR